jgi:hypothetical protein
VINKRIALMGYVRDRDRESFNLDNSIPTLFSDPFADPSLSPCVNSLKIALLAPGMGSVSRFAVSHSPVPVIVVRPERKVKKTLAKRQNNPKRGQYAALLGPDGLTLSRSRSRERSVGGLSDKE